jgi:hypothetical protein
MRALLFVVLAACGAQPNQPVLANAPRPDPGAVAGAAAAAAAAVTLASPDSASPEKKDKNVDKKAIKVKEHVSPGALDRLDAAEQHAGTGSDSRPAQQPQPLPKQDQPPKDALDFGQPTKP